ncbi:MAG: nitrogen regulation protein NR(I) [Rhodothalassiaceae bacterium]
MRENRHSVLIADDDRAIRLVLSEALSSEGYEVEAVETAGELMSRLRARHFDVLLTDVLMPDANGLELLPRLGLEFPDLPVIVISAQNTLVTAVKAVEGGAFEYFAKPFDLDDIGKAVAEAARRRHDSPEAPSAPSDLPLVGRSKPMQALYRSMARLMNNDITVTIIGESGTGKELVARALHGMGHRRHGPFIAVNMAAIPRDLIESELFGHEKGAFTGASIRSTGRFEQAQGGTLFLDEIGDMPIEAQTRLLRVLQQGEFTPVGGSRPLRADVRIIAATNRDLLALAREGRFREDLYYRLHVVPLHVPSLRERVGDIPDLVTHFLARAASEGLPTKRFSREAVERLKRHDWPGNVRELENLVRRLSVLHMEDVIGASAIEPILAQGSPSQRPAAADGGLRATVEAHLQRYFEAHGKALPPPGLYDRVLREVELPLIAHALKATRGNQLRAAELLGINRNTLRKKIRELDIAVQRPRD